MRGFHFIIFEIEIDVLTVDIDVCSEVDVLTVTLVTMFKSRFDVK